MTADEPTTGRDETCRCGHGPDRHLPHVAEFQDPCSGGTPGFCGCTGFRPAPTAEADNAGEDSDFMPPICPDCRDNDDGSRTCDPALTLCPLHSRPAVSPGGQAGEGQCRSCRGDLAGDCGHHSWAGLMALLDEHWPDDIFPTRYEDDDARDAGARIVSLMRWVHDLTEERDAAQEAVQRIDALADQLDRDAEYTPITLLTAHAHHTADRIRAALDGAR
jgi:hypothetical protein